MKPTVIETKRIDLLKSLTVSAILSLNVLTFLFPATTFANNLTPQPSKTLQSNLKMNGGGLKIPLSVLPKTQVDTSNALTFKIQLQENSNSLNSNRGTPSWGTKDGSGGDPYIIHSAEFANKELLDEAAKLIEDSISKSHLNEIAKMNIQKELIALVNGKKIRTLPNIIIINSSTQTSGQNDSLKDGDFIALGGLSQTKLGANIYLAEKTLSYDVNKLANLVLHEVLHNVFSEDSMGLAKDELFIETMANSLIEYNESNIRTTTIEDINKAIELKGYYRKEYFSARGLIELMGLVPEILKRAHSFTRDFSSDDENDLKIKLSIFNEISKKLPADISELTIEEFLFDIQEAILQAAKINNFCYHYHCLSYDTRLDSPMSFGFVTYLSVLKAIKKLNTNSDLNHRLARNDIHCKNNPSFFNKFFYSCPDEEKLRFKDLIQE